MSTYPHLEVSDLTDMDPQNPDMPGGEWLEIDAAGTWVAAVRRSPIIRAEYPLTEYVCPVGDKLPMSIMIPPWCLAVQWGICATGQGTVSVHASDAPCSDTTTRLTLDDTTPVSEGFGDLHDWIWTTPTLGTAPDEFEPRAIEVVAPTATWQLQSVLVWVEDDVYGTVPVTVFGIGFYPMPRSAADGSLV